MIFPCIEETRSIIENIPISRRDVATQCFLELLTWFRVIILQDAVFLRERFPSLNLWLLPPFDHPLFEEFSGRLRHEADFGEDTKINQFRRTMPTVAQAMHGQHQNVLSTLLTYHQSSEQHRNQIQTQLNDHTEILKPVAQVVSRLSHGGLQMRTQFTLDDLAMASRTPSPPNRITDPVGAPEASGLARPRTSKRPVVQYQLDPKVTTIPQLWEEYDRGIISMPGAIRGPSIRYLDSEFDNDWRHIDPYRKQYTRRQHIWEAINRISENLNISPEVVAEKMERWRCNHRYSINRVNDILKAVIPGRPGPWGENDIELRNII